jgi:hypothetical protein
MKDEFVFFLFFEIWKIIFFLGWRWHFPIESSCHFGYIKSFSLPKKKHWSETCILLECLVQWCFFSRNFELFCFFLSIIFQCFALLSSCFSNFFVFLFFFFFFFFCLTYYAGIVV